MPVSCEKWSRQNFVSHLEKRPIWPVYQNSANRLNKNALKLLTVVDWYIDGNDLYDRITAHPKLLVQLLKFKRPDQFVYYNYDTSYYDALRGKLFKCTWCELIAPLNCTLTHMVITHDVHLGFKKCPYCLRYELDQHLQDDSFDNCYKRYEEKELLEFNNDDGSNEVIIDFYEAMKHLSKVLDILVLRNKDFGGIGHAKRGHLVGKPDLSPKYYVFRQTGSQKTIGNFVLNRNVDRALTHFYGNNCRKIFGDAERTDDAVVISDREDEDDNNAAHDTEANSASVLVGCTLK